MSINISDLKTEFGAYYINGGQNLARLYKKLFTPVETEEVLTSVVTEDTHWRASKARMTSILQAFQKGFTPKGVGTFEPLLITQQKLKGDVEIDPDEIEESWLGFLADSSLDRREWPIIRYMVENMILPKLAEDLEREALFHGIRKEPTANVAGPAHASMNGLRYIRNKAIIDGKISPIVLGAPPIDNKLFYEYLEDFIDQVEDLYRDEPMQLCMSKDLMKRAQRGKRELYGKDNDFDGQMMDEIMYSRTKVKGLYSHHGSNIIWATPVGNAVKLSKGVDQSRMPMLDLDTRQVKLFTDFWKGVGFVLGETVFTTDVEFGTPVITSFTPTTDVAAGGAVITVTGKDLRYITAAKFGATNAAAIEIVSDTQVRLTVPALSAGAYAIVLTNEFGTTESEDDVTITS